MRAYSGIYIDAGYLIAAAATRVTGTSLRSGVVIDHDSLIDAIIQQVEKASGLQALRVNWYDSAANGVPNEKQRQIALLPRVKVRLGRLSPYSGEQKGVDLRIGLDLSNQGRRRVVDVAYLVSGDDDLTEAVEEAQSHGVQVIILAVPGADGRPHGVAQHLLLEADGLAIIDDATIDSTVHAREISSQARSDETSASVPSVVIPSPAAVALTVPSPADVAKQHGASVPAVATVRSPAAMPGIPAFRPKSPFARTDSGSSLAYSTSTGQDGGSDGVGFLDEQSLTLIEEVCQGVVGTWARSAEPGELQRILAARPSIPGDLDRALLVDLSARLNSYDLDEMIRHELRARFWEVLSDNQSS